jgi:hypothetical protein
MRIKKLQNQSCNLNVSVHYNEQLPSSVNYCCASGMPKRQQFFLSTVHGHLVRFLVLSDDFCDSASHSKGLFVFLILFLCRLDGEFMKNRGQDGIVVWDRREFQQLFGMFSNAATVDQVVKHMGEVCIPSPSSQRSLD